MSKIQHEVLAAAAQDALKAPSPSNTQPWPWRFDGYARAAQWTGSPVRGHPELAEAARRSPTRLALLELVEPALARAIAAARLRLGGVRVVLVVRAKPPGELLVDVANWSDLLVVGAPADAGLLERGSITHHVVRQARCPVVVVRSCPVSGNAVPRGPFRGHVVVGVDGSASARAALEFGFAHAAGHRLPLVAVHATPRGDGELWFDEKFLETHLTAEPAALTLLAEEVEPWQHKYPDVAVKRAVFVGRPLEALLRASNGASLLIVGSSRRVRDRRLLGSVAHGAVDRALCPLGVVAGDSTSEEAGP